MQKLLFIDACLRENSSRTLRLANYLVTECLKHPDITLDTLSLLNTPLAPLNHKTLDKRNDLIAARKFDDPSFALARQFAQADAIILAAPFWDLSFPSMLRVYLEQLCVTGLTFHYNEKGAAVGDCCAKRLAYVTTRGGFTGSNPPASPDFALPYLQSLCTMLGIPRFDCIAAEGLDIIGNDIESILSAATLEADTLARSFWQAE